MCYIYNTRRSCRRIAVSPFRSSGLAVVALALGALPCAAQMPETRLVDVDGYAVRVRVGGKSQPLQAPTVVLDSAFREPLESWDSIFAAVALHAPVVAYDRAGNGRSADDGGVPTPRHVAERLHA